MQEAAALFSVWRAFKFTFYYSLSITPLKKKNLMILELKSSLIAISLYLTFPFTGYLW